MLDGIRPRRLGNELHREAYDRGFLTDRLLERRFRVRQRGAERDVYILLYEFARHIYRIRRFDPLEKRRPILDVEYRFGFFHPRLSTRESATSPFIFRVRCIRLFSRQRRRETDMRTNYFRSHKQSPDLKGEFKLFASFARPRHSRYPSRPLSPLSRVVHPSI